LTEHEENDKSKLYQPDRTRWKESPYLLIKGFLMGSADIVPGVSGGTMALITGVYDRLIFAIKSADTQSLRHLLSGRLKGLMEHFHWKFLFLLLSGILLAVIFFTRIVPLQIYMHTHPEVVYGLFFGLIVGSIILLIAEIDSSARSWKGVIPLLAGTLFGFWIVTLVPADTPTTAWFVFISGAISICAMILPGISGSYILLILHKYDYILSQLGAIGTSDTIQAIINLVPFFFGAAVGLILFSRVLSWLLKHFHATTLLVLIGFLIGSLYVIWPYQDRTFTENVRYTEVLPVTDPEVQQLLEREEVPRLPRFQRAGEVVNPDASPADQQVVVETVSLKMTGSAPFLPWRADTPEREPAEVRQGVTGMVIGLVLIIGIAYLRRKSNGSSV
jgi:putative membrane protein